MMVVKTLNCIWSFPMVFDISYIQLVTVFVAAFIVTHKLGLNKPYYLLGSYVVDAIVGICTDKN